MDKTLGARISELRRAAGLTQDNIAEKLGISAQAVSKWENDISCPDIMILPELAKLLGVSVDTLLSGESKPETQFVAEKARKSFDELMLRIIVDDGGNHVRVNLPLPLIKILLDSGASLKNMGVDIGNVNIDWNQILLLVENGVMGKLVEVDGEDGENVVISVE